MKNLFAFLGLLAILILPTVSIADHHGTRCPEDFSHFKTRMIQQLHHQDPKLNITLAMIQTHIEKNTIELTQEGKRRPHDKVVPIPGALYSQPFSFTTCQIEIKDKQCPAIKWCYPYKQNANSIRCGKIGVALPCKKEQERCKAHPNLPECIQPSPRLERCLANPKAKHCKKLLKSYEKTL